MNAKYVALTISLIAACSLFAYPWGHRYDTEQPWQNTNVEENTELRVSVEWGEGGWDGAMGSAFGYGDTLDGTDWTWVELPWFEDGGGANKRTRTDVTFSDVGTNWYAYRMIKNAETSYQLGSADWSENAGTLAAESYVFVVPEPFMIVGLALIAGAFARRCF
jgi:hypothetical protein